MKKIFLFITAMLIAFTASAGKVWNITADKADTLKNTIGSAGNGDTIVMAKGTYTASSSIGISNNLVFMAADKNNMPLVKARFGIQGGKRVEFHNLKFDASLAKSSHLIYANDSTPGNQLVLEGCEFSGDTANSALIHCSKSELLDSCIINNCYFHEIKKSCFFNENVDVPIGVKVTNSTFANISTVKGSYYAGVIDTRATSGKVRVDHCTFYNCYTMNTDYAIIGKIGTKDAIVSNCIFSLSSAGTSDYRTIRDKVTAKNCLVYNYTTDSHYGMQGDVTKENCIKDQNPLFVDASKGFQIKGDWTTGEISPARGAGTDGTCLGDPRWYTAETLPNADLTAPYFLDGSKAQLKGTIYFDTTDSLHYYENAVANNMATWRINALNAGRIQATINYKSGTSSGHLLKVVVLDEDGNRVGDTLSMASTVWTPSSINSVIPGSVLLPKAGTYTIKMINTVAYSAIKLRGLTLSLASRPAVLLMGDLTDWSTGATFTPAADGLTATITKSATKDTKYEFKLKVNGNWRGLPKDGEGKNYRLHRGYPGAVVNSGESDNIQLDADYTGDYTFTWFFENDSLAITFPVVPDPVFYIAGDFTSWDNLNNMVAMTENEGICTASVDLGADVKTKFKILKVDGYGNWIWYGAQDADNDMKYGQSTDWQLTTDGGGKDINLTTTLETSYPFEFNAANAHLTVTIPDPSGTSIDSTVVGEKAVKRIVNGQLFIEKDGRIYNILGSRVK